MAKYLAILTQTGIGNSTHKSTNKYRILPCSLPKVDTTNTCSNDPTNRPTNRPANQLQTRKELQLGFEQFCVCSTTSTKTHLFFLNNNGEINKIGKMDHGGLDDYFLPSKAVIGLLVGMRIRRN